MDESTIRQSTQFGRRFLSFFICFFLAFFTVDFCNAEEKNLVFEPSQSYFFAGSECMFSLVIPSAQSSLVQYIIPQMPDGIVCISSKKSSMLLPDNNIGTQIQIWFMFTKAGNWNIPNVNIYVGDVRYKATFETVLIYEDPSLIQPEITFELDNGMKKDDVVKLGQQVTFTVYLRYVVQLVNFSWNIPENALFSEIQRYKITEGEPRGREFTPERIPVAQFEWTPLVAGKCEIPEIFLTVTSYKGIKFDLSLPEFFVNVEESYYEDEVETAQDDEDLFAYAFVRPESNAENIVIEEPSLDVIKQLVDLRQKERKGWIFNKIADERKIVESSIGIVSGENEPHQMFLIIFASIAVLCFIVGIICFKFKALAVTFVMFTFFIASIAGVGVYAVKLFENYGIFVGGQVYPIPEDSIETSFYIHGGSRVRIVEKTGSWMYIRFNTTEGWVHQDTIYSVKSF